LLTGFPYAPGWTVPSEALMDLLLFLVVALIILALLGWILALIPMDQMLRNIIMVVAILIVILWLLRQMGYV